MIGQRDFSGRHPRPAADHRGVRQRVVGRTDRRPPAEAPDRAIARDRGNDRGRQCLAIVERRQKSRDRPGEERLARPRCPSTEPVPRHGRSRAPPRLQLPRTSGEVRNRVHSSGSDRATVAPRSHSSRSQPMGRRRERPAAGGRGRIALHGRRDTVTSTPPGEETLDASRARRPAATSAGPGPRPAGRIPGTARTSPRGKPPIIATGRSPRPNCSIPGESRPRRGGPARGPALRRSAERG